MKNTKISFKRIIITIILLSLLVVIAVTIIWSLRVYLELKQLKELANEAKMLISEGLKIENFSPLYNVSLRLNDSLYNLQDEYELASPVIKVFENFPKIGPSLRMIKPGLDYASNAAMAAIVLEQTILPLLDESENDPDLSPFEIINNFIVDNETNFIIIDNLLLDANASRELIDPQLIPVRFRDDLLEVDDIVTKFQMGFQAVRIAPHLLGVDEPITYLILVQNQDELRATGGFISAFGLLCLREGRILGLEVEDSTLYNVYNYVSEIRKPPFPMQDIMFANYLVARDANWSPDFPTSAALTQEIYYLTTGISTDNVLAIDQKLIVDLLEITGPVTIAEENFPIDANNVEDWMIEYKQAALNEGDEKGRKDFLYILMPKLIEKLLENSDLERLIKLGKLLIKEIQTGHLLLYSNDPNVQKLLAQMELDGAVRPDKGDFIMLVDSNLGFGKVDQFINRSLKYSVNFEDPAHPQATVYLRYEHTQPGDEPCLQGSTRVDKYPGYLDYNFSRCYWNYWRVIQSNGTSLEDAVFDPVPPEYFRNDLDWKNDVYISSEADDSVVFGGLTVIAQQEVEEITLKTNLPSSVIERTNNQGYIYSLKIQKQAGINSLPLELEITPPLNYKITHLSDDWIVDTDQNLYAWEGVITKPIEFQLEFVKQ